jgi:hypothetical protein
MLMLTTQRSSNDYAISCPVLNNAIELKCSDGERDDGLSGRD